MSSPTERKNVVFNWAKSHGLSISMFKIPNAGDNLLKRYGSQGLYPMCEDMVPDLAWEKCGNYPGCKHVAVFEVKRGKKVVGVMLMAIKFSARAHHWGDDETFQGFHVQDPEFDPNRVSDLLIFCTKDNQAKVGQLLLILSMALSLDGGLFSQVGLVMKPYEITSENMTAEEKKKFPGMENRVVGTTYMVQRPYYTQAAFHMFEKYGFRQVRVTNNMDETLTSLYFFRPKPLKGKELKSALKKLEHIPRKPGHEAKQALNLQQQAETDIDRSLPQNPFLVDRMVSGSMAFNRTHDSKTSGESSDGVALLDFPLVHPSGNLLDNISVHAGPNTVTYPGHDPLILPSDVSLNDIPVQMDNPESFMNLSSGNTVGAGAGSVGVDLFQSPFAPVNNNDLLGESDDLLFPELFTTPAVLEDEKNFLFSPSMSGNGHAYSPYVLQTPVGGHHIQSPSIFTPIVQDPPIIMSTLEDADENPAHAPPPPPKKRSRNSRRSSTKGHYPCQKCGEAFTFTHNLRRHEKESCPQNPRASRKRKVVPPGNFACPHCPKTFTVLSNMRRHVRSKHNTEDVRLFKCPLCNYSSPRKHNVTLHVDRVHEKTKKYKCDYCDYATSDLSGMYHHEQVHSVRFSRLGPARQKQRHRV